MGLFKKIKETYNKSIPAEPRENKAQDSVSFAFSDRDYRTPDYEYLSPDEYKEVAFTQSGTFRGYKRISLSVSSVTDGHNNIKSLGYLNPSFYDDPELRVVPNNIGTIWYDTDKYLFNLKGKTITIRLPLDKAISSPVFVAGKVVGTFLYRDDFQGAEFYDALMNNRASAAYIKFQHRNKCECVTDNNGHDRIVVSDSFRAYLFLKIEDANAHKEQ